MPFWRKNGNYKYQINFFHLALPFLQLTRNAYLQLNIEVRLDVGQIPNLKEFVSHLTQTMHSSLPGSLVIWFVKGEAILELCIILKCIKFLSD